MDTSGINATNINTQRGPPQPYTALFHHLAKTLPLTPWPSAPCSISLGKDQLPLNPVLRNAAVTATLLLSTALATGICSPHLTHQINQNSTSLRWLYYYYDTAMRAKVLGKTDPSYPLASPPQHTRHYQTHTQHIIHTTANNTMEYTRHSPTTHPTNAHILTHVPRRCHQGPH